MALARIDLARVVAAELAPALRITGLPASDESGAMKEPLDRTFRALGFAEADLATATVTEGMEQLAITWASYHVLKRAVFMFGLKGAEKDTKGYAQVVELLDDTYVSAKRYGLREITATPYFGGVDLNDGEPLFSIETQLESHAYLDPETE